MPTSKVNRNYQVTIPKEVREKAGITRGETVTVEYDDGQDTIKITPPKRGKRKSWALGSKLTLDEIEAAIPRA